MDLDDKLRELFADERLDLPTHPDAAEGIVAGARRRRRARVAVAATFALTVLVAGGAVVNGVGRLVSEPAGPARSTVVETVTVAAPPVEPNAYATLKLGMTEQQVRDSDTALIPVRNDDKCAVYSMPSVPGDAVVVSKRHGVVRITRPPTSVTPRGGIGAGSSVDEVLDRYPNAQRSGDRLTVGMSGTPAWRYVFPLDDAGKVSAVRMESTENDCDLGDG